MVSCQVEGDARAAALGIGRAGALLYGPLPEDPLAVPEWAPWTFACAAAGLSLAAIALATHYGVAALK